MRPLVLLDVDGVLNPQRRSSPRFRRYEVVVDGGAHGILLDPRYGAKLVALARETGAELAWATVGSNTPTPRSARVSACPSYR